MQFPFEWSVMSWLKAAVEEPNGKADLQRNEVQWREISVALGSVRGMQPPEIRRKVGALS